MKAQLATVALVSLMLWSSSAAPAQTERRGCRAGYSFNLTSDLCELCLSGTFTDTYNWENRCQPCSPCSEGRLLVAACNASSNTVCKCADDHYEHEDGCSPKTGTTRSGMEELNPILQGIEKQIGMEARKSQDKIDNLAKAVDLLRKDAVSGAYAEELVQAITDKMQTHLVVLCVVVVVVVLFLLVSAMLIIQCYSKLVDFCRSQRCCGYAGLTGSKDQKDKKRDQPLDGLKDQKDEKRNQPLDDSHASPSHGHGSASSQQRGASGGTDTELRRRGSGDVQALAMAVNDDSLTTGNFKNGPSRVEVSSKEVPRNRGQAEIDLHGNPNEETPFLQSNDRN